MGRAKPARRLGVTLVGLGLLVAAAQAPAAESLLPPTCAALLEPGGFSSRYRVIDPLARVTACRMKGAIEQDVFDLLVKGRVELWARRCFTEREQGYLHSVIRQATLQTMPFVTRDNCASHLEQLLTLPEPRPRR